MDAREQKLLKRLPKRKNVIQSNYNSTLRLRPKEFDNEKIIKKYIKKLYSETKKEINYVEVGVKVGGTFRSVIDFCKKEKIPFRAIAIDLFDLFVIKESNTHAGDVANQEIFDKKIKDLGYEEYVISLKGDSHKSLKEIDEMDCVVGFIDGNHTYKHVKKDYELLREKMNKGYIVFDDINPYWYGVNKFYNELPRSIKVETGKRAGVVKI